MRYIRTKGGRIIDCTKLMKEAEERTLQNEDDYKLASVIASQTYDTSLGWQRRVEKTADTIEELCDNIVVFDTHGGSPAILSRFLGSFDLRNWFEDSKRQNDRYVFYGAIWTDKGLIYVAKKNENGVFELI